MRAAFAGEYPESRILTKTTPYSAGVQFLGALLDSKNTRASQVFASVPGCP
jgi:hypothetical protein